MKGREKLRAGEKRGGSVLRGSEKLMVEGEREIEGW